MLAWYFLKAREFQAQSPCVPRLPIAAQAIRSQARLNNIAMPIRNHAVFWVLALAALLAVSWLFRDVLLPFALGIAIAYLLNPLVNRAGKFGMPRAVAVSAILFLFILLACLLLWLILPPLYSEAIQLANAAPGTIEALWQQLQPRMEGLQQQVNNSNLQESLGQALRNNISNILDFGGNLLSALQSGGRAVVELLSFFLLTPLIAFMVMLEWPGITQWIDQQIPRHYYEQIRELLDQIDRKIAGFVRGQLLVALALALVYAIALTIAGLQYGFLIGAAAGLLSIIPLFGSTVGLLASVVVAWFQAESIGYVAIIAGIFIAGQLLEGNVITPRLIGKSVGLHPLWILFAILAGSSLMGILGMLLAVPVAASTGVLLGFALQQYRNSSYYQSD
jgi:predicted PurR-regulated permease PerM